MIVRVHPRAQRLLGSCQEQPCRLSHRRVIDVLFGFLPWAIVIVLGDRLGRRMGSLRFQVWRDRATGLGLAGVGGTVLATTR